MRYQKCHAGAVASTQSRTTIKAKPANPQHAGANHGQNRAMRWLDGGWEAAAFANNKRTNQRGRTGGRVNDNAASKIQNTPFGHDAAAPDPMRDRCVNGQKPDCRKQQQCGKFHPLNISANNQRRGDDSKGHLEGREQRFRNAAGQAVNADTCHEHLVQIAEPGTVTRKGQRIGGNDPQDRHQARNGKMMHQHRHDVFRLHKPGIKQRKPGQGHEQYQRGGRQDPGGITGIKPVRCKGGQGAERKKGKRPAE